MDILTQALLGSSVAQLGAKKSEIKIATFIGCIAGILADADIFIQSANDPLLFLDYHRHFTHAIAFVPIGALIGALVCWPFVRNKINFSRLYFFTFLGYLLSGVLDGFTGYGTYLLLPFSDERVAANLISIIDPIFTLSLLVGVIGNIKFKSKKIIIYSLLFCTAYLYTAYVQQSRAINIQSEVAVKRGHIIEKSIVKPTLGNIILWRSIYLYQDNYYIDAIRVGLSNDRVYQGEMVKSVIPNIDFSFTDKDSQLYQDIIRFQTFSNHYIAFDPRDQSILGDVRYSILPNSASPLWGVTINPKKADEHTPYLTMRKHNAKLRQQYIDMILGEDIKQ
ncbi:MAG: metal-dependent hydrolase [Gammaproteobacteria bacterium]|nr:metal-dependent hydrolase [Gammaproteobacteria bacterium]